MNFPNLNRPKGVMKDPRLRGTYQQWLAKGPSGAARNVPGVDHNRAQQAVNAAMGRQYTTGVGQPLYKMGDRLQQAMRNRHQEQAGANRPAQPSSPATSLPMRGGGSGGGNVGTADRRTPGTGMQGPSNTGLRLPPGPLVGSNPNRGFQFGINNAKNIGKVIGAATGIPGLGVVGGLINKGYWQNHQWQSPAPNLPQTGNDMINEAIDGRSSEARGGGRGNISGPAFGGGGGWYYDSSGQLKFSRSGHIRTSGS